jgi:LysM repeat protein
MIGAVNSLRASYNLPAYTPNAILMGVAQAHAEYMASSGNVTHYSADGSRPFQRSLAAGYPLAGDLSLGGFHAENIISGRNMSVYEAVNAWMGDAPHQNTMLSQNLTEIGAGVAYAGDRIYYVIDTARPIGATSPVVTATPQAGATAAATASGGGGDPIVVNTLIPNTPQADGRIIHTVARGETLWLIAVSYGTTVKNIQMLNGLGDNAVISPGMNLVIGFAPTPLPASQTLEINLTPAFTPTVFEVAIESPTFTPTATALETTNASPLSARSGGIILAAIILVAFVMAAFVTLRAPKGLR